MRMLRKRKKEKEVSYMSKEIIKKLVEIPQGEVEALSKAVAVAKEQETDAMALYNSISEKTSDEELRKAMAFLAKEEQEHFDALSAVEEALKKAGKFVVVTEEALKHLEKPKIYPKKGAEAEKLQEKNELTALLWAMRAERKAEMFYIAQAEKTSVQEIKEFFETLAEFELGHYKYLDGIFSAWTSTADFILG